MARILWVIHWWQFSAFTTHVGAALELRKRGHDITFLATPNAGPSVTACGFRFLPERSSPQYDWARQDGMPAPLTQRSIRHWQWLVHHTSSRIADTEAALDAKRTDLIVSDCKLLGAGLAAERRGLRWVSYVDCLLDEAYLSSDARRKLCDMARANAELAPEVTTSAPCWYGLSPYLVLLTWLPEFATGRSRVPRNVHHVGPVDWEPPLQNDPPWLADLRHRRPFVLISTSSCWLGDIDLLPIAAAALIDVDVDIVATVPADQQIPELPRPVIVTTYCPHSVLLPNAGLVLCSGSLGVITKAIVAGVPIITVPRGGDGYLVSAAATRLGAARTLRLEDLSVRQLRNAIHEAFTAAPPTTSARRFARRAATYGGAITAANLIERLAIGVGEPQ